MKVSRETIASNTLTSIIDGTVMRKTSKTVGTFSLANFGYLIDSSSQ